MLRRRRDGAGWPSTSSRNVAPADTDMAPGNRVT